MNPSPQRRLHERFHTSGTVTLTFREGWFGRKIVSGDLVDVSLEGLQARMPAMVPERRRVKIMLALGAAGGEAAIYQFRGRVMWSKAGEGAGQYLSGVRMQFDFPRERTTWRDIIYEALRA
ncbi:MAG: PilZ domain-containing protein [Kiritimatiellia bacterium]